MADRTIKPDDGNDLVLQNNHGNGKIEVNENDTVQVTGNVGVGKTPNSSRSLDVLNTAQVTGGEGTSASLYLVADEGDDNADSWRINSNQDVNDLTISNNTSGSFVDKVTVDTNGNVSITGNLVLAQNKGINFYNYGSNLLDDYEEGTWTITNTNGSSIFSSKSGHYQKIGWMVFIKGYFVVTSSGSTSQTFGGLPFTIKNDEASRGIGFVSYQSQNTTTGNYYGVYGNKNTKVFQFQSPGASYFDANKEVFFSGFYTTDE